VCGGVCECFGVSAYLFNCMRLCVIRDVLLCALKFVCVCESCLLFPQPSSSSTSPSPHTLAVPESKDIDLYLDITEPTGWNDTLDQAWRASVDQTQSPTVLMECLLLLEHYINKAWLQVSSWVYCLIRTSCSILPNKTCD
jgi:hypothetical protein